MNEVPLPERMRPARLEEVAGQAHLLGPKGMLTRLTSGGRLPSMVMWGPPGTGKTSLARLLARESGREFLEFSGVTGSAADLKKFLLDHKPAPLFPPPVLFLDEIHRYNRAQQDLLLPFLERGQVVLIGATTENPAFYLNPALRSRCQLVPLESVPPESVREVLLRAQRRYQPSEDLPEELLEWLAAWSGGDVRAALTGLEAWWHLDPEEKNLDALAQVLGGRVSFDRADGHYDLASAFQKSLRGSDIDAALYYLSRMIQGGEDPRFIARRLMVTAAEDVGNADPMAFLLAEAASRSVEKIGWPEARIPLAQAVIYVAKAPKSNATIEAISAALSAPDAPPPPDLRDAHTATSRAIGRGAGYFYSHEDYDRTQHFLPEKLRGQRFYHPRRPQERSWRDASEPDLSALEKLWDTWVQENPQGGPIPLTDWSVSLNCSREALARALDKLAQGHFVLERKLHAQKLVD